MELAHRYPSAKALAGRYAAAAKTMKQDLDTLAASNGTVLGKKPQRKIIMNQYAPDLGAYPTFAALSNAGAHPSALQPVLFYGDTTTGAFVFDFDGKNVERAYWLTQCGECFRKLLDLAATPLGWSDWPSASAQWKARLVSPGIRSAQLE
ncbi:hypothetical protein ABZ769_11415 [Streptomyces olivoreticuli]